MNYDKWWKQDIKLYMLKDYKIIIIISKRLKRYMAKYENKNKGYLLLHFFPRNSKEKFFIERTYHF